MSARLRETFAERSGQVPAEPGAGRLAAVHDRIARSRRRRAGAAGAGVVVAAGLLSGAVAVATGGPGEPSPPDVGGASTPNAAPSARPTLGPPGVERFPDYVHGARVLAQTTFGALETGAVTVEPAGGLVVATRCLPADMTLEMVINGSPRQMTCGGVARYGEQDLRAVGVEPGEPTTITVSQPEWPGEDEPGQAPQRQGVIGMAVGEPVPLDEYPFPPAPGPLPPLPDAPADWDVLATLANDPDDPLAPRSLELPQEHDVDFYVLSQTPGALHVRLDDAEFMSCYTWDYSPATAEPTQLAFDNGCGEERLWGDSDDPPGPGDTVTVTVTPEHVTGAWEVRIRRIG
jgi:hypothetical protein